MRQEINFKIDISRNFPFVLDAIIEIGIGILLLTKNSKVTLLSVMGIGLIVFGTVQLIRKIKTFHLTENELIVRRPLFPYKFLEERFNIDGISEVRFNNIQGRFGGTHLSIIARDKNADFRIALSKELIDQFECELNKLGLKTVRINM